MERYRQFTTRSKIKIAWMPDNRPGTWMYHCHILEHHKAGMMATFEVIDSNKSLDGTIPDHAHHSHLNYVRMNNL